MCYHLGYVPASWDVVFSLHPPQAIHNNIIIELRETSNANLKFHLLLAVLAKLEGDVEKLKHLELPLFQLAIYCTLSPIQKLIVGMQSNWME